MKETLIGVAVVICFLLFIKFACGDNTQHRHYSSGYDHEHGSKSQEVINAEKAMTLDSLKQASAGVNITVVNNQLKVGEPVVSCINVPQSATLSEIGYSFYNDLTKLRKYGNFGGIKLLFDLSARANGIADVNVIKSDQKLCLYSLGCFNFYIPNLNGNDLTAVMLQGRVKFVKGSVK